MSFSVRMLIVVLLSSALPLQASLAYARAVSLLACKPTTVATAMKTDSEGMIVAQTQHADASVGHALQADHHHSPHHLASATMEAVSKTANHHGSHASLANACDSCAKCCLTGAAAPPLVWPGALGMLAASKRFSLTSDKPSCFIPDGPERPPRYL